jgi:ubiquinone/menaquinone biosynthesis C-methylase UbiE
VTEPEKKGTAVWRDAEFARRWAATDGMADMLELPRHITAALVAHDRPETRLVIDVGSGPGAYLEAFLEELPESAGVWLDASEAMLEQARRRLARFGDRVDFRLGDMANLEAAKLPTGADALISSRALHHLDRDALVRFYRQASVQLVPGGWVANLDHTGPVDVWDKRFRAIRKRFLGPGNDQGKHPHDYPFTSVRDHLDGLAAAGFDDVEVAWKAFYTCLFVARKSS